jgi:HEAT repeat protein
VERDPKKRRPSKATPAVARNSDRVEHGVLRQAIAAGHLTKETARQVFERQAKLKAGGKPSDLLSVLPTFVTRSALTELTALFWKAIEAAETAPRGAKGTDRPSKSSSASPSRDSSSSSASDSRADSHADSPRDAESESAAPSSGQNDLRTRVLGLLRRPRVAIGAAVVVLLSLGIFWLSDSSQDGQQGAKGDAVRLQLVALLATPPDAILPELESLLAQVAALRGDTETAILRDLAAESPPRVRLNAVRLLSLLEDETIGPTLESLAGESDELARLVALDCAGRGSGQQPLSDLVRALSSDRADVRCYAIRALGDSGEPKSLDYLARLTEHPDPKTRAAVIRTILAIRPSALDDLFHGRFGMADAPHLEVARATHTEERRSRDAAPDPIDVELAKQPGSPEDATTPPPSGDASDGTVADTDNVGVGIADIDQVASATSVPSDSAVNATASSPTAAPKAGGPSAATPVARQNPPTPATSKATSKATVKKPPKVAVEIRVAKRDAPRLLREGKPEKVLALVAEAMEASRQDDAELYRLRGLAHLALDSLDAAETDLRRTIDLAPELVVAYFNLSVCYGAKKKKRSAYATLVMALRFGFRDVTRIRREVRLDLLKDTPAFHALMEHYFHSPLAAETGDAKRLKFASKRLQTTFRREKDPFLRALAVLQFPEAGALEATQLLYDLLDDREFIVRRTVAEILGQTPNAASVEFLCAAMQRPRTSAREKEALMWALRNLRGPKPVDAILFGLTDKSSAVRIAAVRAIGEQPDRRAVELLIEMLDEENALDRLTVIESLGKITGENLGPASVDWRNWWNENRDSAEIGPVRNPCAGPPPSTIAIPAAFSKRTGKSKRQALARYGGSQQTELAVEKALEWLARHQNPDGRWDTDQWALRCSERDAWNRVTKVRERAWDNQVSGLALMAFLGAGYTHIDGKYNDNVRRGLEFLQKRQRADGYFTGDHHWRRSHEIATVAMTEAYLMTRDCKLKDSVERALGWVLRRQHLNGGWGWHRQESYTSLTGWNLTALMTAIDAGLKVPASSIVSLRDYLDRVTLTQAGKQQPGFAFEILRPAAQVGESLSVEEHDDVRSGGNVLSTTVGLWCRTVLGQTSRDARVGGALGQLRRSVPRLDPKGKIVINEHLFFGTQAALIEGRATWKDWNHGMKAALLPSIVTTGCERGSWVPSDDHGRVYSTAVGALVLESYYRFRAQTRN